MGGIYNGRRHSQLLRERVLDLHHDGMNPQLIANEVKSSRHFVRNVLRDYDLNNSPMSKMREKQPRSKLGRNVVEYLENEKLCKPSVTSAELQQRLLLDGIVHPVDLPSKSAISKCMREDLVMTKKKIQQVPLEEKKPINIPRHLSRVLIEARLNFSHFGHRRVVEFIVPKTFRTKCRLLFTSSAINCGFIPSW